MTTARNKWSEVGERLEALALKLKLHFAQARDGEVSDALDRLRKDIENAFEAAGHAMKDDAVRADVREAGALFADALAATLQKVGHDLRDAASRKS